MLLTIVNNVNINVQIALQDPAFKPVGYIHRSEIAGWYVDSIFNLGDEESQYRFI